METKKIVYRDFVVAGLTPDEFKECDVPFERLSILSIVGTKPKVEKTNSKGVIYSFSISPREENSYFIVEGKRKEADEKPGKFIEGSSGIDEFLPELAKKVDGVIDTIKVSNDSIDVDRYLIGLGRKITKLPETDVPSFSITEFIRCIREDLGFTDVKIEKAFYHRIVPIDPTSKNQGFNLPPEKIIKMVEYPD